MQKTLNVAQCNVLGLAQWGEGFIDLLAKLALHFCFCFVFFLDEQKHKESWEIFNIW